MTTSVELESARSPGRHHLRGSLLVVLAGFILSVGAITVRLAAETGPWQYTMWRAFAFTIAMWIVAGLTDGRSPLTQLTQLRPIAWVGALMLALSSTTFIAAIKVTTLAETFFLCSLSPLLAAILARPFLGERMTAASLVTIVLGMVGVLVMTEGRLDGGNWTGRSLALLSALGFAGYSLAARGSLPRDLNATLIAFGIAAAVVGFVMALALGELRMPPAWDLGMTAFHGGIVLSLGLALYAQGSRFVSAVTLTVLAQTESILGPLWGFIFFAEHPSASTVTGGAIILTAVVLQTVLGNRSGRAAGSC